MTLLTSIYSTVIANIEKSLGQGGSFFLDSVADHNINISKWNVLAGSSYTKLPNKWEHPSQVLTSSRSSPSRNYKNWQRLWKRLDFQDIRVPVKTRYIHKIKKRDFIGFRVFDYENKEKDGIYVSKKCCKKIIVDSRRR